MTVFDDLLDKVRRNRTHDGSVKDLVHGLAVHIQGLASGAEVPEALRTQLQTMATELDAGDADVSAAILEGTPFQGQAPPPPTP